MAHACPPLLPAHCFDLRSCCHGIWPGWFSTSSEGARAQRLRDLFQLCRRSLDRASHRRHRAPADRVARHRVRLPLFPRRRWVAYTNASNDNADVYVIAAGGGTPRRLTYRPSCRPGARLDRRRQGAVHVGPRRHRAGQALGAPRLFVAGARRGATPPRWTCPACGTAPSAATASGWPTCHFLRPTGPGSAIAAGVLRRSGSRHWRDGTVEKVPRRGLDRPVPHVGRATRFSS